MILGGILFLADILIVTYPELALGYKLAGVETISADNATVAAQLTYQAADNKNIGLIGVDETFYRILDPKFLKKIKKREKPVIIPIPSVHEPSKISEIQEYVRGIVEEATGFYLKIELEDDKSGKR
jgi:vacuolar-type H+-ATPase subunit F/Vma7